MEQEELIERVRSLDNCELIDNEMNEEAGCSYYEISLRSETVEETKSKIQSIVKDTDWQIRTYSEHMEGVVLDEYDDLEEVIQLKKTAWRDV